MYPKNQQQPFVSRFPSLSASSLGVQLRTLVTLVTLDHTVGEVRRLGGLRGLLELRVRGLGFRVPGFWWCSSRVSGLCCLGFGVRAHGFGSTISGASGTSWRLNGVSVSWGAAWSGPIRPCTITPTSRKPKKTQT